MGTANYDASRVTERNRATALYTFSRLNNAAVNSGLSVRREQPDTQLGQVLAQRNTSKAYFTSDTSCPCSQEVTVGSGGNNGNNVQ